MSEKLNVLLVVLGGARADHLGCYGYDRNTTPFVDELSRDGVRFTAAFSTAPGTLPAHASLFTGLFTTTHGASEENPYLGSERPVLPELLRRAGYRTSGFCSNPWVSPASGFGRGFDSFHTLNGDGRSIARAAFYARRATDRLLRRSDAGARRTNLAFFDWLGAADAPFFAFLHYAEPRLRHHAPRPYQRLFVAPEIKRGQVRAIERAWNRVGAPTQEGDEEQRQILVSLYDGALRYIDSRLAEVAEHLTARGLWDRTLVIVTSDHGQDLGEHLVDQPDSGLYDTQLRVPLLVRCPAVVPQGFVVEELAQHVDVLPTFLHLSGCERESPPCQGRVLLQDGRATAGPSFVVAERFRPDVEALRKRLPVTEVHRADVRMRSLRTRREKYVWRSDESNEYYDLASDPAERRNRAGEAWTRAGALRTQLFDWLAAVERYRPAERPGVDEVARQRA